MNTIPLRKLALVASLGMTASVHAQRLALPPIPEIPTPLAQDSVPMGDSRSAPEVKLGFPIESGPFQPTWESIAKNYPGTPSWLGEAKFGILRWKQEPDALVVTCPGSMQFSTAIGFKISVK